MCLQKTYIPGYHSVQLPLMLTGKCSKVIKEESKKKRIAAWGEADFMPINGNPFFDTSYDDNQIT